MIATTGNKGPTVRSDCFISLSLQQKGGLQIDLKSKVKALYGRSIINLCQNILEQFDINHAKLHIDDSGALSFVIAARLEAAIKKLVKTEKEFLLPTHANQQAAGSEGKFQRRSRLYLPGNNPKLMLNAGFYNSDGIILDLEDSVASEKKDEARIMVRNALRAINFCESERMVRINQLPLGIEDIRIVASQDIHQILVPKVESAEQIKEVEAELEKYDRDSECPILIMPIIESALGVIKAYEIASSSERIAALAIGLEDYTADIGAPRTNEGKESLFARRAVLNAAAAAGKQAIDSVFSDVDNMIALKENIATSKAMGYIGMGCIHPRQIPTINEGYSPDEKEIRKAIEIELAFEKAEKEGLGVVSLGSKMIDPPVVKRAATIISNAIKAGKLSKNWRENYEH